MSLHSCHTYIAKINLNQIYQVRQQQTDPTTSITNLEINMKG